MGEYDTAEAQGLARFLAYGEEPKPIRERNLARALQQESRFADLK